MILKCKNYKFYDTLTCHYSRYISCKTNPTTNYKISKFLNNPHTPNDLQDVAKCNKTNNLKLKTTIGKKNS